MRKSVAIVFVLLAGSCWVQGQQTKIQRDEPGRFALTAAPALLPVRSANFGLSFGAEYRFSTHIAILLDNSFYTGLENNSDSSAMGKKYYRFKPEFRYYFRNDRNRAMPYAGIQGGFAKREWKNLRGGYYFSDLMSKDSAFVYDAARIKSPVTTLSAQLGVLFFIGPSFSLDYFAGVGWREINTSYSEQVNLHADQRSFPKDGFSIRSAFQYEGKRTMLHLNTGIRFVYHFHAAAKPAADTKKAE